MGFRDVLSIEPVRFLVLTLALGGCVDGGSHTSSTSNAAAPTSAAGSNLPGPVAGNIVRNAPSSPASPAPTGSAAQPTLIALSIQGTGASSATVGAAYIFTPTILSSAANPLLFTIINRPAWANFDSGSGRLSGTPTHGNVGTSSPITISVSDGTSTARLTPFSITITESPSSSLTLSWLAPTANSDGSPLTDLSGYKIYYGTSATSLDTVVTIVSATETQQVIGSLKPGTWFFALTSFNHEQIESALSPVVPVTI